MQVDFSDEEWDIMINSLYNLRGIVEKMKVDSLLDMFPRGAVSATRQMVDSQAQKISNLLKKLETIAEKNQE